MTISIDIPMAPDTVKAISALDRFEGRFSASPGVAGTRLARLEEAARIQSIAASCRLGGVHVTESEVAALLRGEGVPPRDAPELLGYAQAMTTPLKPTGGLWNSKDLRRLHGRMIGHEERLSPWRSDPLHREEFDAEGRATGRIFATLPPRLIVARTEELLTWLEFELRSGHQHPVLVIGAFLNFFLAISPFERGNGRLSRLLGGHLLQRIGYGSIRYASIESEIEQLREEYYQAMDLAQTRIWTGDADIAPWMTFFLRVLDRHRQRVEGKLQLEQDAKNYPPLQQAILEAVREHGSVDAGLLIKATGANRNTLKDNLRRLVQGGVLEKTGQKRGTRYRLGVGTGVTIDLP